MAAQRPQLVRSFLDPRRSLRMSNLYLAGNGGVNGNHKSEIIGIIEDRGQRDNYSRSRQGKRVRKG